MAGWFPDRAAYFVADLTPDREIFQGDVFRGVPTVFVGHPAAKEAAFAVEPRPTPQEAERPLYSDTIRDATSIHGGYAMVIPHPCDYSELEKGATHSVRLVARLERIREHQFGRKELMSGRVQHAVWVPAWDSDDGGDDWFVDLRSATSIDATYLNPERRVAALSGPAWIALMRRLCVFYTRTCPDADVLALEQAHQHPDYANVS